MRKVLVAFAVVGALCVSLTATRAVVASAQTASGTVTVVHGLKPGDPGFSDKLAQMQKDNSVYDIASIYAVQDVIRPDQTRDYLLRMLDVHQLRKTNGVGRHLLSSWPTSF